MGNPAWGHGYHTGFVDGAKRGGVVGALVTVGVGAVLGSGVWAVGKLRDRGAAKFATRVAAESEVLVEDRHTESDAITDGIEGEGRLAVGRPSGPAAESPVDPDLEEGTDPSPAPPGSV